MEEKLNDKTNYTEQVYTLFNAILEEAHNTFFKKLYDIIPDVVFSVDWKCRQTVLGYCVPYAFKKKGDDTEDFDEENAKMNVKVQFIAINPSLFNMGFRSTFGTFVHELCHLYEHKYIGVTRGNYHSKKWEYLMNVCGLEAVFASGRQSASTKIPENGIFDEFLAYFKEKHKGLLIPFEKIDTVAGGKEKTPNRNKIKYTCLCNNNVWGKAGLHIYCTECDSEYREEE